jgi:carboxyl-terminal processing protease
MWPSSTQQKITRQRFRPQGLNQYHPEGAAEVQARRWTAAAVAALQVICPITAPPLCCNFPPPQPLLAPRQVWAAGKTGGDAALRSDPVVEESWNLLKKFYIDRSFNGQDWNAVRIEANRRAVKLGSFKATVEMVKSLDDKYTRLVDAGQYTQLSRFDIIGAGVLLAPNDAGLMSVASPPMADSSALKEGIKKGDIITTVNGRPTDGLTSFDIVDLVMADRTPTLEVTVKAAGGVEKKVVLDRKVAALRDPVTYRVLDSGSGYIRLDEFNALCPTKLREAVERLKAQGVNRYILDLRGNPGGTFQTAVNIAGIFMDDSVVTFAADGTGARTEFRTKGKALTADPLVVWIDRRSASASEVLAGALKDNCRALVAGDRSFGKGLIQGVFGLEDGSGLIITVAAYQTPAGIDINGIGVQPDIARNLGRRGLSGVIRKTIDMSEEDWGKARSRAQQRTKAGYCTSSSSE